MIKTNLKERIGKGEQIVGLYIGDMTLDKAGLEKILGGRDYDYFMVDSQHRPFTEPMLAAFCQTAEELGMPVVFRIMDTGQVYMIGKYLDMGPSGIEVPQVAATATAAEAVDKFYFPPRGIRSSGSRYSVRIHDFNDRFGYIEKWNRFGILWLQLESVEAVNHARQLALPGVDCLSFGPSDLSIDMHFHPHPLLKTVDDCVAHAVRETEGTGTVVCFRHGASETRQKYWDMGVKVLLETLPA